MLFSIIIKIVIIVFIIDIMLIQVIVILPMINKYNFLDVVWTRWGEFVSEKRVVKDDGREGLIGIMRRGNRVKY